MAEKTKAGGAAAGNGATAMPSPAPLTGFILELYFPVTKAILPENHPTEHDALRHAFTHLAAFPKGFVQIREAVSNRVILNHQQIYMRHQQQKRG